MFVTFFGQLCQILGQKVKVPEPIIGSLFIVEKTLIHGKDYSTPAENLEEKLHKKPIG